MNTKTLTSICTIVIIAGVFGCKSATHIQILQNQGHIRFEAVENPDYDYIVYIENYPDIGWNGNKKPDRLKAIDILFRENCSEIIIVDEKPFHKGDTGFRKLTTWIYKIKCVTCETQTAD